MRLTPRIRLQPAPDLWAGEHVVWYLPCGMSQRIAVGGMLVVTNQRVMFIPSRLQPKRDLAVHAWRLSEIDSIGVQERDFTPYTGGMQRRLRLTLKNDPSPVLFVTKHPDQTLEAFRTAVDTAAVAPPLRELPWRPGP